MTMTFILGVLFTGIGLTMAPFMLQLMNTPENVLPESTAYLTIYFSGVMGLMFYNIGSGILRAVGARSSDVFKIFFSEAFIIAMINFILSTAVVIAGIIFVNNWMHSNGINITILTYGVRQFALMLALSVGVAFLSSFLPVNNIARRKPVDAIKDK
jgi:hypothetical protein